MTEMVGRLARQCVLALLWVYSRCLSRLKPACCRFYPTCSAYAQQAVRQHGVLTGGWLTLRRLLRCHPFYRGPLHDPVPEKRQPAKRPD